MIREYQPPSLWHLYQNLIQPLSATLSRIELRGVRVDLTKTLEMEKQVERLLNKYERKFYDKYGYINYNASTDCRAFFVHTLGLKPLKHTKKGQPSIDKGFLEYWASEGVEAAEEVRTLRRLYKMLNGYIRGYILGNHDHGIVYINYNQTGTVTGRLSSSGGEDRGGKFNAQNLSNDWKLPDGEILSIRSLFIPRKGYKFVHRDASQSELRILGWYSNDPMLVNAATNNYDLHCVNCSAIEGIPFEEVYERYKTGDKEIHKLRRDAKNVGFAIIYGAQSKKIFEMLGGRLTRPEVNQLKVDYFKRVPDVLIWKDRVYEMAAEHDNQFFTAYGRRRTLNDLLPVLQANKLEEVFRPFEERADNNNESVYRYLSEAQREEYGVLQGHRAALREGLNYVIQSTSVEYLNYGMIELTFTDIIDHDRAHILLQTHDSIDVEVKEEYVDEYSEISGELLVKPKLPIDINMKFDCEIKESLQ